MTSVLDRTARVSAIGFNVIGIGAAILSGVERAPDWVCPVGITVAGMTTAWALWKYFPFSRPAVARRLTAGLVALVAATLVAFTWPNSSPGASASPASVEAAWAKTLAHLRKDIKPDQHASIGCTTIVSGTGWIPDGFDIWTAVLNDSNGSPNMSRFFGLEKATYASGDKSWATAPFSVGESKTESRHFWIFVYLVPEPASSVLSSTVLPGDQRVSLAAPVAKSTLLAKIPVERAASAKCSA
ncbi:hypothetical protein [Streptomyces sp. NPDC093970]|uniref:hypothetical protein n=1 Tax=Streptomyces sp. NPDC093970 TaxID=3155076 RepID=UPI0034452F78